MPATAPIAFLSDYGLADEFVGVVHGVILRIAPEARVIDVTHQVRRGDVRAGALALVRAVQYLPPGVALAVVDPGVGTGRRGIAVSTAWGFFVGPDNGLLAPAVAMIGGAERVVSLEDPRFRLPCDGSTFEGRDVFAPAAAVLASEQAGLDDLGPEVSSASLMPLLLPLAEVAGAAVQGRGVVGGRLRQLPDQRGPRRPAGDRPGARGTRWGWRWRAPATRWSGKPPTARPRRVGVVHVDSYGLVAVAVPGGRADDEFGLVEGTPVVFGKAEA